MKRTIGISAGVLASILVLGACSSSDSDTASSESATTSAEESTQEMVSGAEVVIAYQNDVATLDPAIGYDWQNWSIIKSMFDGLLDYEPGTTNLIPDLAAEMPTISADGLEYTFTLKPGVMFHNGRELTAEDVKYSIERAVNPATGSPGAGFFSMLAGFDDAAAGTTDTISGIEVVDPTTIKFTLSRPDATFLHVMAINFASVVPIEEVEKYGEDFGRNPVGSGAFKLGEWVPGQQLKIVKNTDYFKAGQPSVDAIVFEFGIEPTVALAKLKAGEVDVLGDGIPSANYIAESQDSANEGLIIEGGQLHTGYVTLNVTQKPFDNLKVRQAVNYAINKERIVQIVNGRAVPANQPLPPSMPGYNKSQVGYPYDVAKAKALLTEAGFPNGFDTELWTANVEPNPRIAQAIQQDLAEVGITAEIKSVAPATVIEAGGNGEAPMIWSGGMGWIADFPDPSNFYGPILGCGGAEVGGWNWSKYCNEALDVQAAAADAMTNPADAQARLAAWSAIFDQVVADAPWIPIFNEKRITMRSPAMGGANALYVDPVHIPVHYDYVTVTK